MYVLLLWAAALAATASGYGYQQDREYHYLYKGFLYTGFPNLKSQYSGLAFDADVIIQPHGDYWSVKLDDVKLDKVNQVINDLNRHQFTFRHMPAVSEHLTRPFRVFMEKGQVKKYQVAREEPEWSVNIKRGLLNFFQLNLENMDASRRISYGFMDEPDHHTNYYKVMEDGITGECETEYVITSEPYQLTPFHNNVLNVTKSRNNFNCIHRPMWIYETFAGQQCVRCEAERKYPMRDNIMYRYNIRGDHYNYIIESARAEGDIVYSPYGDEGEMATIFMNRTLILNEELPKTEDMYITSDVIPYYTLMFQLPHKHAFKDLVDLKQPHFLYDIYGFKAPFDQIKKLFFDIAEWYEKEDTIDIEEYTSRMKLENLPGKYLELVRAFSTLGYKEIEEVHKKIIENPTKQLTPEQLKYMKRLLVDVLSFTGTNPAFLFAKYLIQNRPLPHIVIRYLLQTMPHHIKEPSRALFDEFYRLCEDSHIRGNYELHTRCYLSFSSLVHETCVAKYNRHHEYSSKDTDQCTPEMAADYMTRVVSQSHWTSSDRYTIALMRTLSNFGVKEVLDQMKTYVINEDNYPVYQRVSAIWTLLPIVRVHSEMVIPLIAPIYLNTSEDHEIRITAFTLLMASNPDLYQMESIVRSLEKEEDRQVFSYVFSTLNHLSNSTHPCYRQISGKIRKLHYLWSKYQQKIDMMDCSYSRNFFTTGYEDEYDYGGFTQIAYIASNTSYIPRSAWIRLNDYMKGQSYDALSIGYHAHGLDKVFDRIFGPNGLSQKDSLFDFLRKRSRRDASTVQKELREIDKMVHIKPREYEPIQGDVFIKVMGYHVGLYQFDEETFSHFFKENEFPIPDISKFRDLEKFAWKKFFFGADKMFMFPNDIGIPVMYDHKMPVYFQYKNNDFKLQLTGERGKAPSGAELKVDGHILMDREIYGTFGVVLPFENVALGVGVHRSSVVSLPIKLEWEVEFSNPKLNFKWKPVIPHNIYHHSYQPFTFIDSHNNYVPVDDEDTYVPLFKEENMEEWKEEYFRNFLGVGLKVTNKHNHDWNDRGSWWEFFTMKDFRQKFYYYLANPHFQPYHFDVTLTPGAQDSTEELTAKLSYEYHGRENAYSSNLLTDDVFEEARIRTDPKFSTHVLKGEILGRGQSQRKIIGEVTYTHSPDRLNHKINVYYERTPFHSTEKENVKVCISGNARYPRYDLKKFYEVDTVDLDHSANMTLRAYFGKDCKSDKKITLQARFDRTEEQEEYERRREEPLDSHDFNPYGFHYQKCSKERQMGVHYGESCQAYIYEITKLLKYKLDVEYENIPRMLKNLTYKTGQLIKHYLYPNMDNNAYDDDNSENRIRIEGNISLTHPVMDLRVYKPFETTHYSHLHVPDKYVSTYPLVDYTNLEEYFNQRNYPFCLVEKDTVHTFDDLVYMLPPIDCYKIISKDCSPNEDYLVLGSKISHSRYSKAVKVFLGKWKVEILPVNEESDLIVRVDGKKVPVTETEPYFETDEDKPAFHVRFNSLFYTIHSDRFGLVVHYDGKAIFVKVSSHYRGKTCGLCGDFNGQIHGEFRGPENCVYYNSTTFAYSYVIPEEGCNIPKFEDPCIPQYGEGCTLLRNHLIHITKNRAPHICFSTIPLPKCTPECKETRRISKTIPFHCLQASDTFANYLKKESIHRVLHEIKRKTQDHYATVEYPEKCSHPNH